MGKKTENWTRPANLRTLAHDSKYCIVGEAWGHNGRQAGYYIAPLIPLIGCWSCVKLGREMGKIANSMVSPVPVISIQ